MPPPPPSAPPVGLVPGGTKPENLNSSHKRVNYRGPGLYQTLLPLAPPPPSLLNTLLSSFPGLSLSRPQIKAVYDTLTKTISVSDQADMVMLWRRGFFGKGTLSRSEPAFKRRVENMRAPLEGKEKRLTAEEITAQRRIERKATKLTKKLEREADKLAAASAAATEWGGSVASSSPRGGLAKELDEEEVIARLEKIVEDEIDEEDGVAGVEGVKAEEEEADEPEAVVINEDDLPPAWHLEAETTQLQPEEAFFLLFSLGCLSLRSADPWRNPDQPPSPSMSILTAWNTFLTDALIANSPPPAIELRSQRWDSPFLVSYAVFHHYRSMGWVIRSGVKFCTDWVLYGPGGPVGGHAEFAVVVLPSYADPEDAKSCPFRSDFGSGAALAEGEAKGSWKWFNTVNRVCSGVKKTLVLLYVLIPPLSTLPSPQWISENPAEALARFEMREVVVRRFMPGRMRD